MRILIATPAPPGSRNGNRITALRWARLLREQGHKVFVSQRITGRNLDVLVALHARKSFTAITQFRERHPGRPIVLALTGTDLYRDIRYRKDARQALDWADRLIVLQSRGIAELTRRLRQKVVAIYQSVFVAPTNRALAAHRHLGRANSGKSFDVCVLGHLRPVKDPMRVAKASRIVPQHSRLRVIQVGAALSPTLKKAALTEMAENRRYHWVGEVPHWKALRILARCQLMVLTSKMEGGANALCESIALGIPVLSSKIAGSAGILGANYPGYFPVGDTTRLARLLQRAETDPYYYDCLRRACLRRAPLVDPRKERKSWNRLLRELNAGPRNIEGRTRP